MTGFDDSGVPKTILHWDPNRTDYTVTPGELDTLSAEHRTSWSEAFFACITAAVSCLLNSVPQALQRKAFSADLEEYLNLVLGTVALVLAAVFAAMWAKSARKVHLLVKSIKEKPELHLNLGVSNVQLPTADVRTQNSDTASWQTPTDPDAG